MDKVSKIAFELLVFRMLTSTARCPQLQTKAEAMLHPHGQAFSWYTAPAWGQM